MIIADIISKAVITESAAKKASIVEKSFKNLYEAWKN